MGAATAHVAAPATQEECGRWMEAPLPLWEPARPVSGGAQAGRCAYHQSLSGSGRPSSAAEGGSFLDAPALAADVMTFSRPTILPSGSPGSTSSGLGAGAFAPGWAFDTNPASDSGPDATDGNPYDAYLLNCASRLSFTASASALAGRWEIGVLDGARLGALLGLDDGELDGLDDGVVLVAVEVGFMFMLAALALGLLAIRFLLFSSVDMVFASYGN